MSNQTFYVDPSYTAAITGKTHATTGEVLNYGVNAFAVLNEAVPALHSGDSLYINGLTSDISVAVPVSLHLTDSTAPVLAVGPVAAETTASGALGRPRGMEWGGRRAEGSGWGTHVYLWRIHFDIWQN